MRSRCFPEGAGLFALGVAVISGVGYDSVQGEEPSGLSRSTIAPDGLEVFLGPPLPRERVRDVVLSGMDEILRCYRAAGQPDLTGKVVVKWTILANGRVEGTTIKESTLDAPSIDACIVDVVTGLEFPRPLGGGIVNVTYPFEFIPSATSCPAQPDPDGGPDQRGSTGCGRSSAVFGCHRDAGRGQE